MEETTRNNLISLMVVAPKVTTTTSLRRKGMEQGLYDQALIEMSTNLNTAKLGEVRTQRKTIAFPDATAKDRVTTNNHHHQVPAS